MSSSSSSSSYQLPSDKVCVTGASGYVATELVKQLLEDGYNVNGTVRSIVDEKVIGHLKKFGKAFPGSTLTLLEADLYDVSSFTKALKGCKVLFHTAAPFHFDAIDAKQEIMKPTVDSIFELFEQAAKAGIHRVVLTSSVAGITSFLPDDKPKKILTEDDWNENIEEQNWIDNPVQTYMASKSLQERAAIEAADKFNLKLSVINPGLVTGPVYSNRVS